MKETGVLLLATLMILSTVVVSSDTNNDTPEFMLADGDYISQPQTNMFDPDWIHFDDGTNVNSIGIVESGTFEFGIRITPTELVGYDDFTLTVVKWYHYVTQGTSEEHSGEIKIYDGGTSTMPGALITTEPYTVEGTDWFEIPLSNPVIIDASKDIWVTVEITHIIGEYPAGVGPGPVVPGKGGWITTNGGATWRQLGIDYPGLNYNWNLWAKVETSSQPPETPEIPDGPSVGAIGVECMFSTTTTEPDGDDVYYLFDWDDGTDSGWLGPFDSGAMASASHSWSEVDTYEIRVKAKDVYNVESDWSDSKVIDIVDAPILEIGDISGGLFKVSTVIKNIGSIDAMIVDWSITLDGGIILLGRESSGSVVSIPVGDEATISSSLIFGFGKTMVTVSAEISESSDTSERDAFVLLFLIL